MSEVHLLPQKAAFSVFWDTLHSLLAWAIRMYFTYRMPHSPVVSSHESEQDLYLKDRTIRDQFKERREDIQKNGGDEAEIIRLTLNSSFKAQSTQGDTRNKGILDQYYQFLEEPSWESFLAFNYTSSWFLI